MQQNNRVEFHLIFYRVSNLLLFFRMQALLGHFNIKINCCKWQCSGINNLIRDTSWNILT